jgi:hypothetical protein
VHWWTDELTFREVVEFWEGTWGDSGKRTNLIAMSETEQKELLSQRINFNKELFLHAQKLAPNTEHVKVGEMFRITQDGLEDIEKEQSTPIRIGYRSFGPEPC